MKFCYYFWRRWFWVSAYRPRRTAFWIAISLIFPSVCYSPFGPSFRFWIFASIGYREYGIYESFCFIFGCVFGCGERSFVCARWWFWWVKGVVMWSCERRGRSELDRLSFGVSCCCSWSVFYIFWRSVVVEWRARWWYAITEVLNS